MSKGKIFGILGIVIFVFMAGLITFIVILKNQNKSQGGSQLATINVDTLEHSSDTTGGGLDTGGAILSTVEAQQEQITNLTEDGDAVRVDLKNFREDFERFKQEIRSFQQESDRKTQGTVNDLAKDQLSFMKSVSEQMQGYSAEQKSQNRAVQELMRDLKGTIERTEKSRLWYEQDQKNKLSDIKVKDKKKAIDEETGVDPQVTYKKAKRLPVKSQPKGLLTDDGNSDFTANLDAIRTGADPNEFTTVNNSQLQAAPTSTSVKRYYPKAKFKGTPVKKKSAELQIPGGVVIRARLMYGAHAPIGGKEAPMVFHADTNAYGPQGSVVPLKGVRFVGKAVGEKSTKKAKVQIVAVSGIGPGNIGYFEKVNGVVYGKDGMDGIAGTLREKPKGWFWQSTAVGALGQAAIGFQEAQKETTQNQFTGQQVSNVKPGKEAQNAALAGLAKGFGDMSTLLNKRLDNFTEMVDVQGFQEVTIVLLETVTIKGYEIKPSKFTKKSKTGDDGLYGLQ